MSGVKGKSGVYLRSSAMFDWMRGRTVSEAVRTKISSTKKGCAPWNKGKRGVQTVSNETRAKLSLLKKGNQNAAGSKNANWKGGITSINIKSGVYVKRRRARLLGAIGQHSVEEWEQLKAAFNYECAYCHISEPTIQLHRDHIQPLTKGGSDFIENIQPLCRSCNSKKSNKFVCSTKKLRPLNA